jgi:hypothetical protein
LGIVIAGGITSGTMLASQYMNLILPRPGATVPPAGAEKEESKIMSEINSLETKPNWNTNLDTSNTNIPKTFSLVSETSDFINAPLEEFNNLSMMTLGIITINFFIILGLLFILINYLISFIKLESKEFVIKRPLLKRILKASEKSREFMTKFVFLFTIFGTCSMFYFLCYLLYFLKDLGL